MLYQNGASRAKPRRMKISLIFGAVLSTLFGMLLTPPPGYPHEPITTNVRFNKEVIRIFQRNCLDCHSAGRIKADIPLGTYEEARPWAKAIKEEILEKRMPPYQAVKGYGHFQRDYGLTQREIELIVSWVEGGAPKGEEKDLPRRDQAADAWQLGKPAMVLQPTSTTKVGTDEEMTKCFIVPTGLKEDRWVSAIDFRPGDGRVVNRATMSVISARQKANACSSNITDSAAERLADWSPGQGAISFPAGVARLLQAGTSILLKVSYQGAGEPAEDRSSVGLYFASGKPNGQLQGVTIAAARTNIPAEANGLRVKASYVLPAAAEAVGLRPLLYPYAKSVEVTAHYPDGTVDVLAWAKNRRYEWDPPYFLKKPLELPQGTRIEVTAYLDNTADNPNNPHDPPKAVQFSAPLCDLFLAVGPANRVASK